MDIGVYGPMLHCHSFTAVLLLPFNCILPITKDSYVLLCQCILIFYCLQSRGKIPSKILHIKSLYFNIVFLKKDLKVYF